MRYTVVAGWASVTSGAARILRMRGTITPTVWHHMIVSSGKAHADLHLSVDAERWR
jgi:hypothetical protein